MGDLRCGGGAVWGICGVRESQCGGVGDCELQSMAVYGSYGVWKLQTCHVRKLWSGGVVVWVCSCVLQLQ